jgi:lipopolysaccharide cholinephosphotransferase
MEEEYMEFEESFFEGEERDGFYIEPMMKRAWASQMEVLSEITKICKKYKISYFAEWGTLLGAVRHKGFIPWDDDLDIGMLREDYNRFIQVAQKELPPGYKLATLHNWDNYYEYLARVVNEEHIRIDEAFLSKHHGCPYVCGIDIFPLDYVPKNPEDKEFQMTLIDLTNSVGQMYDLQEEKEEDPDEIEAQRREMICQVEEMCGVTFDRTRPIKRQLYELTERLCQMYTKEDDQVDIGMPILMVNFNRPDYCVPRECYETIIDMPFESASIPVPAGYDQILTMRYGDYMNPVKHWDAHDYPFYKEQKQILETYLKEQGVTESPFFLHLQ